MTLPANWAQIPVSGTYLDNQGNPARGYVRFDASQVVTDGSDVILPRPITFRLDSTGSFSGTIPATNDPDINPTGWQYEVREYVPNGRAPFFISVPYDSAGIDMATVSGSPTLNTIPVVTGGVYASRTSIAGLNPTTGSTVYLTESGREGTFIWSASDHSADVTADPQQGIYIPPTSDTTGASGAWKRLYHSNEIYVEWFLGSNFDADTDDATPYVTQAVSNLGTSGGRLLFTRGYKLNYTVTTSNLRFVGVNGMRHSRDDYVQLTAYDPTQYTLSIGDGVTGVEAFSSVGISLNGRGTAQYGVKVNGANRCNLTDLAVAGFTARSWYFTSTATQSTSYIFMSAFSLSAASQAGADTLYAESGGSYTTAIYLENGTISAQSGAGHAITLDGVTITLQNVWVQAFDKQGVKCLNGGKLVGSGITIDSDASTDVLVEVDYLSTDSTHAIQDALDGFIKLDGYIGFSDGVTRQATPGQFLPYRSSMLTPRVFGSLGFQNTDGGPRNQDGSVVDNDLPRVYVDANGNLTLDFSGAAASGSGIARIKPGGYFNISSASANANLFITAASFIASLTVNASGSLVLAAPAGGHSVVTGQTADNVGFFGNTGAAKQAISGALSAVTDANAKAVLTSIIAALSSYNLISNGTT